VWQWGLRPSLLTQLGEFEMAVAAHVSRVSKEYAPFGYSITQSATACAALPAGGTAAMYIPIVHADDADIYVEEVTFIAVQGHASESANYWTVTLVSGPLGLASESAVSSTSIGGVTTAVAIKATTDFTLTTNVVTVGNGLYLKCDPNHASSPQKTFGAVARYRRKA